MPRVTALERVDVEPHERVRARRGDLLDVDPALRREHEERLLRAAVEREREVVLALDVRRPLDPHLRDDVAADVHAEDLARARLGLVGGLGELDPTRLAATAGQHLRLHDDGKAELLGRGTRLRRTRREPPLGHRDPVAPEELLPLVLVEVQSARESTASTREPGRRTCASISAGEPDHDHRPPRARRDLRRLRARVERAAAAGRRRRRRRRASPPARSRPTSTGARRTASAGEQLVFTVDPLEVTETGWSARVGIENRLVGRLGARTGCDAGGLVRPPALRDGRQGGARGAEPSRHAPGGSRGDPLRARAADASSSPGLLGRRRSRRRGALVADSWARVVFGTLIAVGQAAGGPRARSSSGSPTTRTACSPESARQTTRA